MTTVTQELFERQPAPALGKPAGVWTGVSKRTVLDTADAKARPWLCRCPNPMCFWNTSHKAEKDAQTALTTHACPWFAGGPTHLSWGVMAESFVTPIWKLLDECMDGLMALPKTEVMDTESSRERETLRAAARAYANTLAILMPPFFKHPDEIAAEAKVRYDKRTAGEEYETPGLGRRRYERAETTKLAAHQPTPAAGATQAFAKANGKTLTDQEVTAVKMALTMSFPVDQLAKTYGVSEAEIKKHA